VSIQELEVRSEDSRKGFALSNPNVRLSEHPLTFTIDAEAIPWTSAGEGFSFKLLHVDHGSGRMTLLFKMAAGSRFGVHKHYAPVEFFVLQGAFGYEAGVARRGFYGMEGAPAVHEPTCDGSEDMIMLVFTQGGFQAFNEDGSPGEILDARHYIELARANGALGALERADNLNPLTLKFDRT
jgi:quercetin dioxygenase-like cupin family protein